MIPVSRPSISQDEVDQVTAVLKSGWLAQGQKVKTFEERIARYLGRKYAVATSSGTTAIHLALLANGIGAGNEVIVPAITFVATSNAVIHAGAKPIFVDVDEATYNMDHRKLKRAITNRTKAIMSVHLYGQTADMDPIREICEERDLLLIEDAAEALGAEYKGRKAGSLGKVACFSFHPVKTITTGEGGMIVTDDEDVAASARSLRSHGEDVSAWDMRGTVKERSFPMIGFNYRMSDVHAVIGLAQLARIDEFIEKRRRIASYYNEKLSSVNRIQPPFEAPYAKHVYGYYVIKLAKEVDRRKFMESLRSNGVGSGVHFNCVHLEPAYRERFGYKGGEMPVAEDVAQRTLSIPMYPGLGLEEAGKVVEAVEAGLKG